MKIGISWGCYRSLEISDEIELMQKNGFEVTFLQGGNAHLDEIMQKLRKAGIECENLHAPFSKINAMWQTGQDGERMLESLLRCADHCAAYEIPVMVVHLSSGAPAPCINEIGYERFAALMEHAKHLGVTVAYENQRFLANLAFAMERFPDAGFCWDVGHEACFSEGIQFMPLFGNRLHALHIHDNMKIFNSDMHLIPYDGIIDFDLVAEQIAKTSYEGSVMLELVRTNSELYAQVSPNQYYKHAAAAARRLEEKIRELRQSS